MPDLQNNLMRLSVFKNALLAPLGQKLGERTRHLVTAPVIPAAHATSHVTRHDHHNIEIKTVSELGSAESIVETDIYLFIPKNFELNGFGKTELTRDFRSRMRLSLPVSGEQGMSAFESALGGLRHQLERLEESIAVGTQVHDLSHPLSEDLLEATRDVCAVVAGAIKYASTEHVREFFMTQSLLTTPGACVSGLRVLNEDIRSIRDMVWRVRKTAHSDHSVPASIFAIFDEYMSQLYVQYLGTMRTEIERMEKPKDLSAPGYESERRLLHVLLDQYQSEEAKYRARFGSAQAEETELDHERRLVRFSHLKKFFQSKSFVDVTRQKSARFISESTAAAGTAAAAFVAAMLERFSRNEVGEAAFSGLAVLTAGVIFYVLRDRLKDRAKVHFQETAARFLPDFEQQLVAQEKKIGTVKEWFRLRPRKTLSEGIQKLRENASANEMEKRLPEDVLHCRRVQEVDASLLIQKGVAPVSRSLHENTRVNFERYLKHMDDPFKDFTDLDSTGRFKQSRSHRVYHFYICVRTTSKPADPKWTANLRRFGATPGPHREQTLLYRIVLDKNGIVRLEDLAV